MFLKTVQSGGGSGGVKKEQTITTTRYGLLTSWEFTFNDLSEIFACEMRYQNGDIDTLRNTLLNDKTELGYSIQGNTISFNMAGDNGRTWNVTAVAVGI